MFRDRLKAVPRCVRATLLLAFLLGAQAGALAGEPPAGQFLTGVEPARHDVTGGSRLRIFGEDTWGGFQPGYSVEVNGVALTDLEVLSPTTMTGLVPPNAVGQYDLVLRDGMGAMLDALPGAVEYILTPLPPVEDISATRLSAASVRLSWSNPTINDRIRVRRNGVAVATLAGDATQYTDTLPSPPTSAVVYEITAESGVRASLPAAVSFLPWRSECLPIVGTGGSGRASGLWAALVSGGPELQMCFRLEQDAPAVLFQVYMSKVRAPGQLKCRVRSIDPPHDVLGPAYDGIVVEDFELFRADYTEAVLPAPLAAGDYIVGFYSDGVAPNQWSYELQLDGNVENPGEPCPPPFYPMLKITPLCNNLPPTVLDITAEPPHLGGEADPERFDFGRAIVSELGRTLIADAVDFDGAVVAYGWTFSFACNRQPGEDEALCLERCRAENNCLDAGNSAGNSMLYNFPYVGTWTVGVTVTDNAGATAFASETLWVDVYTVPPDCGAPPDIYDRLEPDAYDPFYSVRYIPDINDSLGAVNQKYEVKVTPSNCAAIESVDLVLSDPVNGTMYLPLEGVSIVPGSEDAATGSARYQAAFNMSDLGYRDRFELTATATGDDGRQSSRTWEIPMCVLPLLFDSDHNDVDFVDTTVEYDSTRNRYDIAARLPDGPVLDLPLDLDDLGIHLDNVVDAYLEFNEYLDDEFWHPQSFKGNLKATLLSLDLFDKDWEVPLEGPVAYGCDDYEIQYHANNIDIYSDDWSWEVFDTTLWEGFVGPVHVRVRGSLDVGLGVDVEVREVRLIVRTVQEAGDPVVEIGVIIVPAVEAWAEGEIRVEVFFGLASASVLLRPTLGIEFPIELQGALPPLALNVTVDECFTLKLDIKVRACADLPFVGEECVSSNWMNIFDEEFGDACGGALASVQLPGPAADQPSDLKYPSLAISPDGSTAMAVFVDDTDADPTVYAPELFYAYDDGMGFAPPLPLYAAGDAYTQRDSNVVFLSDTQALAVWTQGRLTRAQVAALSQDAAGANTGFKNQDIYFARWNEMGGWQAPQALTNDATPSPRLPDGKPALAAIPGDDAAWVVWVRADHEDLFNANGDANLRDLSVFARKIDAGVPGPMFKITSDDAANPAADIQPAVAVSPSGNVAIAIWVRDTDGDFDTPTDRRLLYSLSFGAAWTPPAILTNPVQLPGVLMPSVALSSDDDGMVAFTAREVAADGRVAGEGNKDLVYAIEFRNTVAQAPQPLTVPTEKRGKRFFNGVYGRDPIVRYLDTHHAVVVFRSFDGFGRSGGDGEVGIATIDLSQPSPRWTHARMVTDDDHRDWDIAAGVGPSCIRTVRDSTNSPPGFRGMVFQDIDPKSDIVVDRIRLSNPHAPAGSSVEATIVVRNGGLLAPTTTAPATLRFGKVIANVFQEFAAAPFLFTAAPDMTQEFTFTLVVPETLTHLRAIVDPIPSEARATNNVADTMLGILPPTNVTCENLQSDGRPRLGLRWENAEPYESVLVYRDGRLVTQLAERHESFLDSDVSPGLHEWSIRGKIGLALSDPLAAVCNTHALLPGDYDLDADVDGDDFAPLADACLSGPGMMAAPGCDPFDFDGDHDVDLRDLSAYLGAFTGNRSPNLLRNPSFEQIPGNFTGQGFLPSEWTVIVDSPDTYSNDGSFGMPPNAYGNFTGVAAQNGLRWVAGWNILPESFGQQLSAPLLPNHEYRLTGWIDQAIRPDLAHAGAYEVLLATASNLSAGVVLGRFADTTGPRWEQRSIVFHAPADADQRPWLIFRPVAANGGSAGYAYPGLDNLNLTHTGP